MPSSKPRPRQRPDQPAHGRVSSEPQPEATKAAKPHKKAAWGVLVYLAGDVEHGHEGIRGDLTEILTAGGSDEVHLAVQYDGPDGAVRYVLDGPSTPQCEPTQRLGRVDSGSAGALLEFLHWGMVACPADSLALVFGSPSVLGFVQDSRSAGGDRVFALSHDQGSGHDFDASELGWVLREALREAGREQFDLFAIDSCHAQFLELAYELENAVHVLIAPQTEVPADGWNFVRVLERWKELAARREPPGLFELERALLKEIHQCYRAGSPDSTVSALNLDRLDDVAHAFDTLCIGTLQCLGEGLIWVTRDVLREQFEGQGASPVYDCGSYFAIWAKSLDAMADEAYQGWLASTLDHCLGSALDRFFDAVARRLEALDPPADAGRVELVIDALRAQCQRRGGAESKRLLQALGDSVRARIGTPASEDGRRDDSLPAPPNAAQAFDRVVAEAIDHALHLLPQERRFDLRRMEDSIRNARQLARQSEHALTALLGDGTSEGAGLVIGMHGASGGGRGWPRWSGASIYRPHQLDDLMNAGYQRFAFHRRVHWAAMLGAANLIEQHPRALWRLVSSLLSTGAAGTRRDVLRRLTGSDSVIWGLREQFRVMAPAPTLTLSLEQRGSGHAGAPADGSAGRENYLLRLESVTRGAVITEQESRVQPRVMERALRELQALLQRDSLDRTAFAELRSIGRLLGEDIFQSLGRILEDERTAALADQADATPHLQLQIPRELMRYPWELLHHRGEWLGERFAMGRQVYMATGLARRVPRRRQGRVHPLVVGDPVFDASLPYRQLPGARDEAELVAGWFEQASREPGSVIEFDRRRDTRIHCRVTGADMRALLRDGGYDIVHFAGHGVFRADDPETSAWLMSDGELWSLEIRNTLAEHVAPPWLVFANACEAGMDAAAPQRNYQGSVFGLATAFINQGVAAYIAPLWPIDDLLAKHLALEFYRHLLCERTTLGEALRRAKASARRAAYDGHDAAPSESDAVWAGLGWASLVLYGDPTEELFHALAGGLTTRQDDAAPAFAPAERGRLASRPSWTGHAGSGRPLPETPRPLSVPSFLHAPDHVVAGWVKGPNWRPEADLRRSAGTPPEDAITLELVEEAGLRRWRRRGGDGTRGAGSQEGLPGSRIAALLADDRLRRVLPVNRGLLRVVGRWVISGFDDGVPGLVRKYDEEVVPKERLLVVCGAGAAQLQDARRGAPAAVAGPRRRALVIVHGTFSKTASPVEGFGPDFIDWARRNYGLVLGLDHWTLSKTPEENARLLAEELRGLDPELLLNGALDMVCHSRGGLVARAFCELLEHAAAVRNLVFVGTPNCGTDLANPRHWGTFADLLINMTGTPDAELFGRLAGFLAQLAAKEIVSDVPGLLAQNPASAGDKDSFLARLQRAGVDRSRVRHSVVCSEFEPAALVPNLKKLLAAAGVNLMADAFFGVANDLVVNTAHVWGIGPPRDGAALPDFLPPERVLVYRPPKTVFVPPADVLTESALGVHHCNLFGQRRVQESIKRWLSEA